MTSLMQRPAALVLVLVACTHHQSDDWSTTRTFSFGPFDIQPTEEIVDDCVQITLGNNEDIYVSAVELTTGPGFHHSNWFFVPLNIFPGPQSDLLTNDDANSRLDDGTYKCKDRQFDIAVAGIKGNVLFAQSTQNAHEIQQFPSGAALKIPAHSKLVAQIHLLNSSDNALHLAPTIALTPLPAASVTTTLVGMSFENHSLGLPPNAQSAFTVDCDLMPQWQILYNQGAVSSPTPNFKFYYALAHYHVLGTGMQIAALQPDDTTSSMIFQTTSTIGDALGAQIDPLFDMSGFSRIRFTCDYYNNTANTVVWGVGSNEMCVFLAFTDSTFKWGGGETTDEPPPNPPTLVNGVETFSASCSVFARDAT
jgi:hypothetical protein